METLITLSLAQNNNYIKCENLCFQKCKDCYNWYEKYWLVLECFNWPLVKSGKHKLQYLKISRDRLLVFSRLHAVVDAYQPLKISRSCSEKHHSQLSPYKRFHQGVNAYSMLIERLAWLNGKAIRPVIEGSPVRPEFKPCQWPWFLFLSKKLYSYC